MDKTATWYRRLYQWYEVSWLYNLHQLVMDPGRGPAVRRFLKNVPYQSVIDIGCGTGNWAHLAHGRYLGVDGSPSFIAACERRFCDDPQKNFTCADVRSLRVSEPYDLALLMSVLHHLSDDQAVQLVSWVAQNAHYFLILDMYPIHWNPLSRLLYAMDRGNYIREPEQQAALVWRNPAMELVKADSFYSWNPLTRHTLFLFESKAAAFR